MSKKVPVLPVVSARKMQAIDRQAQQRYGLPPIILMENAARACALCVFQMLKKRQRRVIVFCGQGNNGGDGLACSRHLLNGGLEVKIYFAGKKERLSPEAKINYEILRRMGVRILKPQLLLIKQALKQTDLIVDALLGIGLKHEVSGLYFRLIELINAAQKPVLSLDVPSGLEATTGEVRGIAVEAAQTVTFGLLKKGFLNPRAKQYTGEVTVSDIGLPRKLLCASSG